jgi:hypothetical protein
MASALPIILLIVVLSSVTTGTDATAAGPWDGDYRGQGKFDIDRRCIPRKFEAAGVIENNVLTISVRSKGKVVGKLKFEVTDTGRIHRTFLCSSGFTAAFAEGRVSADGIRLRTLPMRSTRGSGNAGRGGTINMSRVPGPQAAQRQPAAETQISTAVVERQRRQPAAAPKAEPPPPPSTGGGAIELAFWESIKNSAQAADYRAYLEAFPAGRFAPLARLRAEQFRRSAAAAPPDAGQAPVNLAQFVLDLGRYRAIVIGNNDYRHVPKLRMAVSDAVAVSETLERLYGFEVELLLDVTRYDILKSLSKARAELTERDNLLVYYAGHGVVDEETGRGYWLPVDAEPDTLANWIANTTLSDMIKAIQAKHVMVVADSCYSGALVRAAPITLKTGGDRARFLSRMAAKRSRTALVSGGLEPVSDAGGGKHSVFAKAFLDALYENDAVLDGQGLFATVRRQVITNADQTPEYSDIRGAGHDGGDFLFVRQ